MSHFFKGSFTIALVATIVSTIIVSIIAYFITKPFDKVLKRLKMNGEAITELEKKKCLSCYNKLITKIYFGLVDPDTTASASQAQRSSFELGPDNNLSLSLLVMLCSIKLTSEYRFNTFQI